MFPGFDWGHDGDGKWTARTVPARKEFAPRVERVVNSWEEDADADAGDADGVEVEFRVERIEATPFGYDAFWEDEWEGLYAFPHDSRVKELGPGTTPRGADGRWRRKCVELLKLLGLPVPRLVRRRGVAAAETDGSIVMQIQMQAFAKRRSSLRRLIVQDIEDGGDDRLHVEECHAKGRANGWSKLRAKGLPGAINIEWDADQSMLTVRAIAKRGNTPHELLGLFLSYLIKRHGKKVASVNVQLR
jgi:hypothetical protein